MKSIFYFLLFSLLSIITCETGCKYKNEVNTEVQIPNYNKKDIKSLKIADSKTSYPRFGDKIFDSISAICDNGNIFHYIDGNVEKIDEEITFDDSATINCLDDENDKNDQILITKTNNHIVCKEKDYIPIDKDDNNISEKSCNDQGTPKFSKCVPKNHCKFNGDYYGEGYYNFDCGSNNYYKINDDYYRVFSVYCDKSGEISFPNIESVVDTEQYKNKLYCTRNDGDYHFNIPIDMKRNSAGDLECRVTGATKSKNDDTKCEKICSMTLTSTDVVVKDMESKSNITVDSNNEYTLQDGKNYRITPKNTNSFFTNNHNSSAIYVYCKLGQIKSQHFDFENNEFVVKTIDQNNIDTEQELGCLRFGIDRRLKQDVYSAKMVFYQNDHVSLQCVSDENKKVKAKCVVEESSGSLVWKYYYDDDDSTEGEIDDLDVKCEPNESPQ